MNRDRCQLWTEYITQSQDITLRKYSCDNAQLNVLHKILRKHFQRNHTLLHRFSMWRAFSSTAVLMQLVLHSIWGADRRPLHKFTSPLSKVVVFGNTEKRQWRKFSIIGLHQKAYLRENIRLYLELKVKLLYACMYAFLCT